MHPIGQNILLICPHFGTALFHTSQCSSLKSNVTLAGPLRQTEVLRSDFQCNLLVQNSTRISFQLTLHSRYISRRVKVDNHTKSSTSLQNALFSAPPSPSSSPRFTLFGADVATGADAGKGTTVATLTCAGASAEVGSGRGARDHEAR